MGSRFFDYTGKLVPGRRPRQGGTSPGDLDTPEKVSKAIKDISQRLAELEAVTQQPATEFEVTLPASGQVYLNHGFNCPVRFFPTWWEDTSTTTSTVNQSTNVTLVTQDTATAITYKFNHDFSAMSTGVSSAATFLTNTAVGNTQGLTFTRGSVSTVQTSAVLLVSTGAVDDACIGSTLNTVATTGLVIQSKTRNLLGVGAANTDHTRNITRIEASGWTAGSGSTNTAGVADSPTVAATGCSRVQVTSGGFSPFYAGVGGTAALKVISQWTKKTPSTGTLTQFVSVDASIGSNDICTLSNVTGWVRQVILKGTRASANTATNDARDYTTVPAMEGGFGVAAAAKDSYMDYFQIEHGNFVTEVIATSGGTRHHDRLSYPTGSQLISATNQFKMYCKLIPKGSYLDQVNYTDSTTVAYSAGRYLFSVGAVGAAADNFAYIRDSDKKLVVKIAGGTQVVSANAISWAAGDVVEIYFEIGSNLPSIAKYRTNSASVWNDIYLGPVAEVPAFGSTPVHFFVNSVITHSSGNNDIGSFPCWLQKLQIYDTGQPVGVVPTTYTSGSTSVNTTSTRPHSPDIAINRSKTTAETLVLNSYNAIKAVIRVEAAPQGTVSPPLAGV